MRVNDGRAGPGALVRKHGESRPGSPTPDRFTRPFSSPFLRFTPQSGGLYWWGRCRGGR